MDHDTLTDGEATARRKELNSRIMPVSTSGTLRLSYFTANVSESITKLAAYTGSTAAGATPTLARMGVYEVAADGALTLVASTTNDTTIFAAANTRYEKATAAWDKEAGQRYAFGLLVVSAAALPTFVGVDMAGISNTGLLARDPRLSALLAGQTDLPASIPFASLANDSRFFYGEMTT